MVLGMHRSGTSALTRVMNLLGADIPKDTLPPSPTNQAGYWESRDLVAIHDSILSSAGSSWDDWRPFNRDWFTSPSAQPFQSQILKYLEQDFENSRLFAIKDPRICRLWPLWREVLRTFGAKPLVVIPFRNPLEVAASLKQRNSLMPAKTHLLWLRHVLEAELATRNEARVLIPYDDLLNDWQTVATTTAARLGLSWPKRGAAVEIEIEQFLSSHLRHHWSTDERLAASTGVVDWVKDAFAALIEISGNGNQRRGMRQLDQIRLDFEKACNALGVAISVDEIELARREENIAKLSQEISVLQKSGEERTRQQQQTTAALNVELETTRLAVQAQELTIANRDSQLVTLGDQLSSITQERDQIRHTLSLLRTELGQAKIEIQTHSETIVARDKGISELNHQVTVARSAYDEISRSRDKLAVTLAEESASAQKTAGALASDLERARSSIRQHEAALAESTSRVASLSEQLTAAKHAYDQVSTESQELRAALEDEKTAASRNSAQATATLTAELMLARKATVDAANLAAEAERKAEELNVLLIDSQTRFDQIQRHRDELSLDLETQRDTAAHMIAQNEDMRRELASLQNVARDYEGLKLEHDFIRSSLNNQENKVEELSYELRNAQSGIQQRDKTIERLSGDISAARLFLRESQSEVQRLAGELYHARADKEQSEEERHRARNEIDAVKAALDEALASAHQEQADTQKAIQAANEFSAAQTAQITDLNRYLERERIEKDRFIEELARATKTIRDLTATAAQRVASLETHHATALAEVRNAADREIRALRDRLTDETASFARARRYAREGILFRLRSLLRQSTEHLIATSGLFDAEWYLSEYPEVPKNNQSPLEHYLEQGYLRGCRPNPLFDSRWYLEQYEDVCQAGENPLVHYIRHGCREGRNPGPYFETDFYLLTYPDVRLSGMNPLAHYLRFGKAEGRLATKSRDNH